MKHTILSITFFFILGLVQAQVVTTDKEFPTPNSPLTITFNADQGTKGLANYSGDIYAHIGVITSESIGDGDWKYAVAGWAENIEKAKCTRLSTNVYELVISPSLNEYFGVPSGENILKIAIVFRSADTTKEGKADGGTDILINVFQPELSLKVNAPEKVQFLVNSGDKIAINAITAFAAGGKILIDNNQVLSTSTEALVYEHTAELEGTHTIEIIAHNADESKTIRKTFTYEIRKPIVVEALPANMQDGINYISDTEVVLVLHAPYKHNVHVIGDFNDWGISSDYALKRTSDDLTADDNLRYWIRLSGLVSGTEYGFQYLIDEELRIADPYTDKVLDANNDPWISAETYPNIKPYPEGKTTGIVSVFETGQTAYSWNSTNFKAPKKEDLVIYELHLRDFTVGPEGREGNFASAMARLDYIQGLGVNAIELMPINEFEGNDSWGYNPSFMFAVDKAYGTKTNMKEFVDECHSRGIAVIIDIVMNHAFGQSPFVQMYLDYHGASETISKPESPWFNVKSPNSTYKWGADFNHESVHTQKLLDRLNAYWVEEYHVDGFRFDFTKGFTNKAGDGQSYDESRITILKRMYDQIANKSPEVYVILEHLADNGEEKKLAAHGLMLWGNMNHSYNEATMGFTAQNNSDLSWAFYGTRGWDSPNLVTYMESHDEERLMYKNKTYGGTFGQYSTKELPTALSRMELAANFFFTIPGPKMIWQFGELGYDFSINENDRVGKKPIKWDYFEDMKRKRLYAVYGALAKLKVEDDVFENGVVSANLTGAVKTLVLDGSATDVVVLGNFDLKKAEVTFSFTEVGKWYEYYSGAEIDITTQQQTFSLLPGEYRLYTNVAMEIPDMPYISTNVTELFGADVTIYPNPTAGFVSIDRAIDLALVKVYTADGRMIFSQSVRETSLRIDLSNAPNGVLLLTMEGKNGDVAVKKILKK